MATYKVSWSSARVCTCHVPEPASRVAADAFTSSSHAIVTAPVESAAAARSTTAASPSASSSGTDQVTLFAARVEVAIRSSSPDGPLTAHVAVSLPDPSTATAAPSQVNPGGRDTIGSASGNTATLAGLVVAISSSPRTNTMVTAPSGCPTSST